MDPEELDQYLLPVVEQQGPWISREDLYRASPWQQVTRSQVAAWTESAENRGLISSRAEAETARRYALTKRGEYVLTE